MHSKRKDTFRHHPWILRRGADASTAALVCGDRRPIIGPFALQIYHNKSANAWAQAEPSGRQEAR